MEPKIFVIGLSKTGTSSVARALSMLGFSCAHHNDFCRLRLGMNTWFDGRFEEDPIKDFDAASDLPIAPYFKELDIAYPGSKFIFTDRSLGSWLISIEKHFERFPLGDDEWGRYRRMLRLCAYGCGGFIEDRFRERYLAHKVSVLEHFVDRPGDLLTMQIGQNFDWDTLCRFLRVPEERSQEFPRDNVSW